MCALLQLRCRAWDLQRMWTAWRCAGCCLTPLFTAEEAAAAVLAAVVAEAAVGVWGSASVQCQQYISSR